MNKTRSSFKFWILTAIVSTIAILSCNLAVTPPPAVDVTPPTVSSVEPVDAAVNVPINSAITATFSEALDTATVIAANFSVTAAAVVIPGAITYDAPTKVILFAPDANLAINTVFTVTISTGIKDAAGNALASSKVWSFTTGATADSTAPTIASSVPASGATSVGINSLITITFSEPMKASTISATNITFAPTIAGAFSYSGNVATFTPSASLATNTAYTMTFAAGITDLAGNALVGSSQSFTTSVAGDTTPPTVSSTVPVANATLASISSPVTATFSEPMNVASLTTTSFSLTGYLGAVIPGSISNSGNTATFTPTSDLPTGTVITATISTAVTDQSGNNLAVAYVWSFTTVNAGPTAIALGGAGTYTVLAESGIHLESGTGTQYVTGDMGISPANFTAITGFTTTVHEFSPGVIDYYTAVEVIGGGVLHSTDMYPATKTAVDTAVNDKLTAYNAAAASPASGANLDIGAGTIGVGTPVFVPGKYSWGSTLNVTGDITLSGGANDIWIFQVTGNMTVASAKTIILAGGAQAKNIYWQVSGITSVGTTSHWEGIILGGSDVIMLTSSSINGRLYSATQVRLQSSVVTKP